MQAHTWVFAVVLDPHTRWLHGLSSLSRNFWVKFVAPVLTNQMVLKDDKLQSSDLVSIEEGHMLGLLSKDLVEE